MKAKLRCFTLIPAIIAAMVMIASGCGGKSTDKLTTWDSDLVGDSLTTVWDEGIPLGNATLGELVWQRDSMLRLSLDRVDIWDLRANDSLSGERFDYEWVKEHVRTNDFEPVIERVERGYKRIPYPTKLPVGAIEFPIAKFGKPTSVRLYLNDAICEVKWGNGARFLTFVSANNPDVGWFRFENLPEGVEIRPEIVAPQFHNNGIDSVYLNMRQERYSRDILEYPEGKINNKTGRAHYHQEISQGRSYDLYVVWEDKGSGLEGCWSLTSNSNAPSENTAEFLTAALKKGMENDFGKHRKIWEKYWEKSSVNVPDSILQRQYDRDMYKLGALTRPDSYPINTQGLWLNDNPYLPDYKGNYNYGMRVPLSYLPTFAGNHPELSLSLINTLWNQREELKKYTSEYFNTKGLTVPGMATIEGEPMGSSTQYGFSPTTGAWIAHNFWLYWKYTADDEFLVEKGYPFVREAAEFVENITELDSEGKRTLEYSTTPTVNLTGVTAWFPDVTNFDLALMKTVFREAAEMASALGKEEEAERWRKNSAELSELSFNDVDKSLQYTNGLNYAASNRYLSNALSIYPLNEINPDKDVHQDSLIEGTLMRIDKYGSRWWVGATFGLHAAMQARAGHGDRAWESLHKLAENFCLPNSFHVNGDMSGNGVSQLKIRQLALEGNFLFAAALQEMLLQSNDSTVKVFPAIPLDWKDAGFENLRGMGGVLVSAQMTGGTINSLKVKLDDNAKAGNFTIIASSDTTHLSLRPGETVDLKK